MVVRTQTISGVSTLEVLLAFTILTLAMSAVIMIVFGNQSLSVTTQNMHEALYLARETVDVTTGNFELLGTTQYTVRDVFNVTRNVQDATPCLKKVSGDVSWSERSVPLSLSSLIVGFDYIEDLDGDCDVMPFTSPWTGIERVSTLGGGNSSGKVLGDTVRDMDINYFDGVPYAAFGAMGGPVDGLESNVWITNISDVENLDTTSAALEEAVQGNVTAIDFVNGYIFAASSDIDGNGWINTMKLNDSSDIEWKGAFQLPGVDLSNPIAAHDEINSIMFNDDMLYVGIDGTPTSELMILNASNPESLVLVGDVDLELHNIHDLAIQGGFIYAATSDDDYEITVVDVGNPSDPILRLDLSYNLTGNRDAESISILGDQLYIGRDGDNAEGVDEIYSFTISGNQPTLLLLDGYDFGPEFNNGSGSQNGERVRALQAKGGRLFALTKEAGDWSFHMFDVSDRKVEKTTLCSTAPYTTLGEYVAIDTLGEYVFVGGESPAVSVFENSLEVCNL